MEVCELLVTVGTTSRDQNGGLLLGKWTYLDVLKGVGWWCFLLGKWRFTISRDQNAGNHLLLVYLMQVYCWFT